MVTQWTYASFGTRRRRLDRLEATLRTTESTTGKTTLLPKPLLRGWFHAVAAVASVVLTLALCLLTHQNIPRLISMLIFGLSMVELYTVSAAYHIGTGHWSAAVARRLRALDHANIFVLIAGTYTPLSLALLSGWLKPGILALIWALALTGVSLAWLTLRAPRWVSACLYVGMGWVALLALPAFLARLPWVAVGLLLLGGVLYSVGALIYALKWPNPFPRVLGFHEVFHLFVIAGSVSFAIVITVWAAVLPRA
jgi:hemolysin III